LRRLRREFPFDAILAAWAYPDAVAAVRLGQELGVPVVTMILGSDVNEFARHPSMREQIVWGLRNSQGVITVSGALRDRVIELGVPAEKVVVQHNGVDGDRFRFRDGADVRARLGLPDDRPLIGYVGNFVHEKGVDLLVEAMRRLRHAAAELVMVGDGPMGEQLRARAAALGMGDRVRFVGRRPHEEVPEWISALDVFCLPSRREGCPNVVLEALASGRPVVAASVGGVPELLSEDTGVLVEPEDPEALARGLEEALSRRWDPEVLRASVPCLSWEEFARALHGALERAVDEWPSPPARNSEASSLRSAQFRKDRAG
jgi:glycosyltransferase involved in cell wall biosynthesis